MNAVMNKLRNARLGSTFILLFLVAIWSAPTIGLLITALRDRDEAAASGWWTAIADPFNQIWSLASFEKAVEGGMLTSLMNTLVISVPATILPLVIAANAAYAFTFIEFKGREVMFASLVALMVLPLQSALIPVLKAMVWLKKTFGIELVGNYASAWVVHAAFALPLAIYILRNFMMTLPASLIEAARIDGASYYQIFWKLVLPMSIPSIASFAIFQFLWVWNDYLIAFVFVGEQKAVMTYKLLR
ncbi:MAG: hypothetical protein RL101_695, partial [Actinomycetota bacterium]